MSNVWIWIAILAIFIMLLVVAAGKYKLSFGGVSIPHINLSSQVLKVLGVLVGVGVAWWIWNSLGFTMEIIRENWFFILIAVMIAVGLTKSDGKITTLGFCLLFGALLLTEWQGWWTRHRLGTDAEVVLEMERKVRVANAMRKAEQQLNPTASKGLEATGVESLGQQTLTLQKGEVSKPLRVQGTNCIWWFGENPDGNAFTVEVRDINHKVWHTWENWVAIRKKGEVENPGWFRFVGNQTNAFVGYELRKAGQCD